MADLPPRVRPFGVLLDAVQALESDDSPFNRGRIEKLPQGFEEARQGAHDLGIEATMLPLLESLNMSAGAVVAGPGAARPHAERFPADVKAFRDAVNDLVRRET